jgi:hypothetical protein
VDKGYTDSHVLVDSQRNYGITIIGPVADDPSWQAQAGSGFAKGDFIIDWDARTATCSNGKQSLSWLVNPDVTKPETVVVRFHAEIALLAPSVLNARGARSSRVSWYSSHASSTKHYRLHDAGSRLRTSKPSAQLAPESKAHTRRRCDAPG